MFTVGFDLDMTLIDSRPGIAATYRALARATGVWIDVATVVGRLGPPLAQEMANWFPPERVAWAVTEFRRMYPRHAIAPSTLLPGAAEALAAVWAAGGRPVVVTAKRGDLARLHLVHLAQPVAEVLGMCWAEGKARALREIGAVGYVGDQVTDMTAARAAGVAGIGVATGSATPADLTAAGATTVLADLTGFAEALDHIRVGPAAAGR